MTHLQPGSKVRVLVVDDSDVDRQVMQDILSTAGFDVHALPSPIGATKIARELQVNVVVVDQNLPSLDGNKLAGLFRKVTGLQNVRIVLVSGADEAVMATVARKANVDAFVSK